MIAALIVLGGFLSLCAVAVGGWGLMLQFANPRPSSDDSRWPLWWFFGGWVVFGLFVYLGFHHG